MRFLMFSKKEKNVVQMSIVCVLNYSYYSTVVLKHSQCVGEFLLPFWYRMSTCCTALYLKILYTLK